MKIKTYKKINENMIPFVSGYALQNYSIAEKGIVDAFQNGYQYWYIDCSSSSETPNKWNNRRINQMVNLIDQYKVYPIVHGNFKVPLSSDIDELRRVAIEYVKKEIDLASELSSPLIIHGGAVIEPRLINKIKKVAIRNFLSTLDDLCGYANSKNVTLYLENLSNYKNYRPFHYIFTQEEEFEFIFSETDIKFFLDLGHANIGNVSPKAIFEKYHNRIVAMSFSNNNGQQDQHLSLMKGTIDYKQIVTAVQSVNWKGIVAFETRDNSPKASIDELNKIFQSVVSKD